MAAAAAAAVAGRSTFKDTVADRAELERQLEMAGRGRDDVPFLKFSFYARESEDGPNDQPDIRYMLNDGTIKVEANPKTNDLYLVFK